MGNLLCASVKSENPFTLTAVCFERQRGKLPDSRFTTSNRRYYLFANTSHNKLLDIKKSAVPCESERQYCIVFDERVGPIMI